MDIIELGAFSAEVVNIRKTESGPNYAFYDAEVVIYIGSTCLHTLRIRPIVDLEDWPHDFQHEKEIVKSAENALAGKLYKLLALVRDPDGS